MEKRVQKHKYKSQDSYLALVFFVHTAVSVSRAQASRLSTQCRLYNCTSAVNKTLYKLNRGDARHRDESGKPEPVMENDGKMCTNNTSAR